MAAHRITVADNPHTEAGHHTAGMPRTLDNVPLSMAEYLEPKSMPQLLEMFRAIESGAPRASCHVWFKQRPDYWGTKAVEAVRVARTSRLGSERVVGSSGWRRLDVEWVEQPE